MTVWRYGPPCGLLLGLALLLGDGTHPDSWPASHPVILCDSIKLPLIKAYFKIYCARPCTLRLYPELEAALGLACACDACTCSAYGVGTRTGRHSDQPAEAATGATSAGTSNMLSSVSASASR